MQFYGISEFTNKISYLNLISGDIGILALLAPIILIVLFYKGVIKNNRFLIILFSFSIACFVRNISNC